MRVGFVGLGQMGLPMARNLVRAGHEVAVWNRSPGRAEELAGEGARRAGSPADAARGAEVVVTMLADDNAVGETVLGDGGVVEGLAQGGIHVGMSTVSVGLARLLRAEHEEEGQHYVSASVFGRPEAAEGRLLRIVAAGWGEALTRCRPVFDALGLKDVRLVLDAADEAEAPMPLAGVLHDRLLRGVAGGRGGIDWSGLARLAAEDAGLGPRRPAPVAAADVVA